MVKKFNEFLNENNNSNIELNEWIIDVLFNSDQRVGNNEELKDKVEDLMNKIETEGIESLSQEENSFLLNNFFDVVYDEAEDIISTLKDIYDSEGYIPHWSDRNREK